MRLVLVIISLVTTAFTGYYTQAQLASNGPKTYSYIDETPELLGESETQKAAFANEESDSGSFIKAQHVLTEPDNYIYIDEDQQITDRDLVIAAEPKDPAYIEVDDMARLLRISYWCRNRDGRCRRRHIPCEDTEDIETPYGGSFCNRNSRRCCYPSPCRKKWCEKANEECVANNWAIEGSCQCKDGYIRDKQNNCVGTCSVIWCDKANEECEDHNGKNAGSCQCADGYVRDNQHNCVGTCAVIWCDKANEECEDNAGTTAGSCQCADGYVRDQQNNCVVIKTTTVPTTTKTLTIISGCGGEYTSSTGTIRHPPSGGNYQNNENCIWIIKAGVFPFEISFISFDTENNFDYLSVRNGDIIEGNFTGSSLPTSLLIRTDTASLLFTSDGSHTSTGFEIQWRPIRKRPE